jgi:hypothetical protein
MAIHEALCIVLCAHALRCMSSYICICDIRTCCLLYGSTWGTLHRASFACPVVLQVYYILHHHHRTTQSKVYHIQNTITIASHNQRCNTYRTPSPSHHTIKGVSHTPPSPSHYTIKGVSHTEHHHHHITQSKVYHTQNTRGGQLGTSAIMLLFWCKSCWYHTTRKFMKFGSIEDRCPGGPGLACSPICKHGSGYGLPCTN